MSEIERDREERRGGCISDIFLLSIKIEIHRSQPHNTHIHNPHFLSLPNLVFIFFLISFSNSHIDTQIHILTLKSSPKRKN